MSRNFCITVQVRDPIDINDEVHDCLHPEEWDTELVRYFIWQLEAGEDTGKQHYQCYLETNRAVRYTAIKKLSGLEGAHIEARKGTREQAKAYCQKSESRLDGPWEFGVWEDGGQGNRTDLSAMVALVKSGKSDVEILDEIPGTYIKYYRAVSHIRSLIAKPRKWKTRVYFIYGIPRSGKSQLALELLPEAFWKQAHSSWWCTYPGGDVILDDFKGWLPYTDLLRVMDRYPLQVQTKGGQANFSAENMVITSTLIPLQWYKPEVHFNWEEFSGRVDVWIHFPRIGYCEEISEKEFFELYCAFKP